MSDADFPLGHRWQCAWRQDGDCCDCNDDPAVRLIQSIRKERDHWREAHRAAIAGCDELQRQMGKAAMLSLRAYETALRELVADGTLTSDIAQLVVYKANTWHDRFSEAKD